MLTSLTMFVVLMLWETQTSTGRLLAKTQKRRVQPRTPREQSVTIIERPFSRHSWSAILRMANDEPLKLRNFLVQSSDVELIAMWEWICVLYCQGGI